MKLDNQTPLERFIDLSGAYWEHYALPAIQASTELTGLLEDVELPVSNEDFAEVKAARVRWLAAWREMNAATNVWLAAADAVDQDALDDDEANYFIGAFNIAKAHRAQALDAIAEAENALDEWAARAAALAPEPGMAAALLALAQNLAKTIPEAVNLWPLVPIGLGALALLWFFGAPRRR